MPTPTTINSNDKPPQQGDLVRLVSGGPLMTFVRLTDSGEAYCVWFSTDGVAQAGNFPLAILTNQR
jgi:uncharacterized protein YodC (DUF2158 family)